MNGILEDAHARRQHVISKYSDTNNDNTIQPSSYYPDQALMPEILILERVCHHLALTVMIFERVYGLLATAVTICTESKQSAGLQIIALKVSGFDDCSALRCSLLLLGMWQEVPSARRPRLATSHLATHRHHLVIRLCTIIVHGVPDVRCYLSN